MEVLLVLALGRGLYTNEFPPLALIFALWPASHSESPGKEPHYDQRIYRIHDL